MRHKIRSRGQKNPSDSTHISFTLELEKVIIESITLTFNCNSNPNLLHLNIILLVPNWANFFTMTYSYLEPNNAFFAISFLFFLLSVPVTE